MAFLKILAINRNSSLIHLIKQKISVMIHTKERLLELSFHDVLAIFISSDINKTACHRLNQPLLDTQFNHWANR